MKTLDFDDIAMVAHEVNRAYCDSLGDTSQVAWDDAPQWLQDSVIAGVHFLYEYPDASPSDSHNSWMAQKQADGWSYGPIKDAEAKTHPCYLPYDELPPTQRAKDVLFIAVVKSLLPYRNWQAGVGG